MTAIYRLVIISITLCTNPTDGYGYYKKINLCRIINLYMIQVLNSKCNLINLVTCL